MHFSCSLSSDIFLEKIFQEYHLCQTVLDPDQAPHNVGPDLDPTCLQRITLGDPSRRRVKVGVV